MNSSDKVICSKVEPLISNLKSQTHNPGKTLLTLFVRLATW